MSLQAGLDALKDGRHRDAVQILKEFCLYYSQHGSKEYIQAQMALLKAYHRLGETEQALTIAKALATHNNPQGQQLGKPSSPLPHQYPDASEGCIFDTRTGATQPCPESWDTRTGATQSYPESWSRC
jgi:hypothetical protein